jgi:hypothetical protein
MDILLRLRGVNVSVKILKIVYQQTQAQKIKK